MLIGIGTDLLELSRVPEDTREGAEPFFAAAFTQRERSAVREKSGGLRRRYGYAAKFAGKEAVYKAISALGCPFAPNEIEILDDSAGRPCVSVHGKTKAALDAALQGHCAIHLSLSFDGGYAAAFAAVETCP